MLVYLVPNAPCGVESFFNFYKFSFFYFVPNAPCGVERLVEFLFCVGKVKKPVPNAPCGVERKALTQRPLGSLTFLMHRVELKVSKDVGKPFHCKLF